MCRYVNFLQGLTVAVVNMQTAVMTADHLPSVAESASGLMGLGE